MNGSLWVKYPSGKTRCIYLCIDCTFNRWTKEPFPILAVCIQEVFFRANFSRIKISWVSKWQSASLIWFSKPFKSLRMIKSSIFDFGLKIKRLWWMSPLSKFLLYEIDYWTASFFRLFLFCWRKNQTGVLVVIAFSFSVLFFWAVQKWTNFVVKVYTF